MIGRISWRAIWLMFTLGLCNPPIGFSQIQVIGEKCLTNNDSNDRYASYSPDGDLIVFESERHGNWDLFLMDSDGKNQRRLTSEDGDERSPAWHPGGQHIIFESNKSGKIELYTIELGNRQVHQISQTPDSSELLFPSISPLGNHIAASYKESDHKSNIVLLDNTGTILYNVTTSDMRSHYPRWSPDGSHLVFFSRKDTDNEVDEIYKIRLEDGKETRLTNWTKNNFCPSWSYDGKFIAYVQSMDSTRPEIFVMDAEGRNKIRLTNNLTGDTLPSWHPKQDKLLITSYRDGNFEICEITYSIAN